MAKINTSDLYSLFVLFLLLVGFSVSSWAGEITTAESFIDRLVKEYKGIEDFSATLVVSGVEPPLSLQVLAIGEPQSLRVEYLSPEDMKGQFFLLTEDSLYQYLPGRDLIIEKGLSGEEVPVEAANLTPGYLLELLRSDELQVRLLQTPETSFFLSQLRLLRLRASLTKCSQDEEEKPFGISALAPMYLPVADYFPFPGEGYVLEVVPKTLDYQFSRQLISFDANTFLPLQLLTYLEVEAEKPLVTEVQQAEINPELDYEKVTALPEGAEVITDR